MLARRYAGDPIAILDELKPAETDVIAAVCRACDLTLRVGDWVHAPFARPFIVLAVERRAERLMKEHGRTAGQARVAAAHELGLSPETLKSWRRRWRDSIRGQVAPVRRGEHATRVDAA